jgi:adenylate kinase
MGLAENFDVVRAEYVLARGLRPVRIWMHGPPGSGKSFWAAKMAEQYYLPHIKLGDIITEVGGG